MPIPKVTQRGESDPLTAPKILHALGDTSQKLRLSLSTSRPGNHVLKVFTIYRPHPGHMLASFAMWRKHQEGQQRSGGGGTLEIGLLLKS